MVVLCLLFQHQYTFESARAEEHRSASPRLGAGGESGLAPVGNGMLG